MKKHMTTGNSDYRLHRFPPLAKPVSALMEDELGLESNWQTMQHDIQQKLEEGFQQGLATGHEEGLKQGREQGKEQGLLEGQKDGFQQGFLSGEKAGKQRFLDAIEPVNALHHALTKAVLEQEQAQRHLICELVQKVAQQVIRAELTLMPQQILSLVNETLDSLPSKSDTVIVQLNPQDLQRIEHINTDLPSEWKLVANAALPVGGCHVVTDHAEADASCDSRLEACMDNVKAHLLEEGQTPVVENNLSKIIEPKND